MGLFRKKEKIPVMSRWRRNYTGSYVRDDGCEVVCDWPNSYWRAMVPVMHTTERSAAWQSLIVNGNIELFPTMTAAMCAVEVYLSATCAVSKKTAEE